MQRVRVFWGTRNVIASANLDVQDLRIECERVSAPVGVQRQYTGSAAKITNCQIGVRRQPLDRDTTGSRRCRFRAVPARVLGQRSVVERSLRRATTRGRIDVCGSSAAAWHDRLSALGHELVEARLDASRLGEVG